MAKRIKDQPQNKKYPSAEFLYSVALEDYNRTLGNYDKIYDRANIALALCSALLVAILNNVDIKSLLSYCSYAAMKKVIVACYGLSSLGSAILLVVATIRLLLVTRSRKMLSFDSNSIKAEKLYIETVEDAALWVSLQYIRSTNDVGTQVKDKQGKLNRALLEIVVSLLLFAVSVIIHNGGL